MAGRSHAIQNARKGRLLAGLALLGLLLIDAPGAAALVQSARAVSYEVQAGDTLISIARRHGVDWRELARSNNLDDANLIRVGETIRIAELPEADPALPAQERAAQTSARRVVPMQPPADEVLIPQQRRTVLAEAPVLSAAIPIVVEGRRYPNVPVETTMSELLAIAPLALATSLSDLISNETIDSLRALGNALVAPSVIAARTGLDVEFDPATISVRVAVPASLRRSRSHTLLPDGFDEGSIRVFPSNVSAGATLGLAVTEELNSDQDTRAQLTIAGFANLGGLRGANLDYGGAFESTGSGTNFRRAPLVAFVDNVSWMHRYSAGDITTNQPRLGGSRALLGIGLDRSYQDLQPTRIVRPTGRRSFVLEREATVEVYSNNVLVSRFVSGAGPIDLTNIPLANITNDVSIVVEDGLGRRELESFSLANDLSLLANGLDEFSFSLGVLRDEMSTGFNYSSDIVASAFYTRGLTDQLTASVHAAYTPQVTNAGGSIAWGAPRGVVLLEAAASQSEFAGSGYAASLTLRADGFFTSTDQLTFGIDHTGQNFTTINDTALLSNLRYDLSANYRFALGRDVGVGVGVSASERYGLPGTDRIASLSISRRLDAFQVGLSARYGRTAQGNNTSGAFLSISRAFGARNFGIASYDTQARTSRAEYSRSRRVVAQDFNYRISAEDRDGDQRLAGRIGYIQNRYEADLNATSRINPPPGAAGETITARVTSGIGFADGTLGVGREPGRGFFMVRRHPTLANTPIEIRRGSASGRVDAAGQGFGPVLARVDNPYRPVTFNVNMPSSPAGYDAGDTVFSVLPGARSGIVVTVGRDDFRTAIANLTFDGEPLALVYIRLISLETKEEQIVFTNRNGRVAFPNLEPGRYRAMLPDRGLIYEFEISADDEAFVNLGSIIME